MKLQKARIYVTNARSRALSLYPSVGCSFSFKLIFTVLRSKCHYDVYRVRCGYDRSVLLILLNAPSALSRYNNSRLTLGLFPELLPNSVLIPVSRFTIYFSNEQGSI